MADHNELDVLQNAYEWILTNIPWNHPLRFKSQGILVELRDCIANSTGNDPEEVQEYYESKVKGE